MGEQPLIVIIEDSDEDYEAMLWALNKAGRGFAVARFAASDQALDYLENNSLPALVLLDLNLSGTGGHETLKTIKSHARWCEVPVIVVTTSTDPKDIAFCYCNGASGYINKPVNYAKFSRSLQILLDYWFEAVLLPAA